MGITIQSKNFSKDMGYGGFMNFRKKVAELTDVKFGEHYKSLEEGMFLWGEKRDNYFEEYEKMTNKLVENKVVSVEIANFCYQSDCEGSIDQNQAKEIYEIIKEYDDNICYGYSGRPDCTMFSDLKNIFKDCAKNGDTVYWD